MNGSALPRESETQHRLTPFLDILSAPGGGDALRLTDAALVNANRTASYAISAKGIPLFATTSLTREAQQQQDHYDKIAQAYVANLSYPHTQEYMAYLDRDLLESIGHGDLGTVVELCCGHGEALSLRDVTMQRYLGIDISQQMLEAALDANASRPALFVQGDATNTPLRDASVDTVMMLGGVHHISDREALFGEIARILKPGGRFIYREPVSDFILWRAIRAVIYRFSPMLDHATERPLLFEETVPVLANAGLTTKLYRTCGFFGFCLFMNSDVLMFNRLFRFVPGIRAITRASASIDEAIVRLPGFSRAGLQVVGIATKPA
jgi:ubiquinone/menaquinone biosynthesis C-methylase UbiE